MEEAYLCGMFRNLGEVLAAAYVPDQYAEILRELRTQKPPRFHRGEPCARLQLR